MGLDFTNIKDEPGVAIFLIHDGLPASKSKMQTLAEEVKQHTSKQIVILSANEEAGRSIIEFYSLAADNAALLVADDDQLYNTWYENEIPSPDQIGYLAEQIG